MRDQLLFAVAPRVAVMLGVTALVVQSARVIATRAGFEPLDTSDEPTERLTAVWRFSMAVIVLGHLLAFASPGVILLWDHYILRLIVLESIGWVTGGVALGCFVAKTLRRERWSASRDALSPLDVIATTLVLLALISGLLVAVLYRWGSYWSAVTLTPYVHSLIGPRATFALVSSMPVLVKFHVLCAFAVVALLPWTVGARQELEAAWSALHFRTGARSPAWRPAGITLTGSREPALSIGDAEMHPALGREELTRAHREEV
jgi:nitrate reductase gamma subunit